MGGAQQQHDEAYAEARAVALQMYTGYTREALWMAQQYAQERYRQSGCTHSAAAACEVIAELLYGSAMGNDVDTRPDKNRSSGC